MPKQPTKIEKYDPHSFEMCPVIHPFERCDNPAMKDKSSKPKIEKKVKRKILQRWIISPGMQEVRLLLGFDEAVYIEVYSLPKRKKV